MQIWSSQVLKCFTRCPRAQHADIWKFRHSHCKNEPYYKFWSERVHSNSPESATIVWFMILGLFRSYFPQIYEYKPHNLFCLLLSFKKTEWSFWDSCSGFYVKLYGKSEVIQSGASKCCSMVFLCVNAVSMRILLFKYSRFTVHHRIKGMRHCLSLLP